MKNTASIVEVVESAGVSLRRQGNQLVGLCPFHADKKPSFAVNPDKQVWCCYACAEGGDVIRFVEKLHGVDFQGALRILGIHRDAPPRPTPQSISLDAKARDLAAWSNAMSIRAATKMRRLAREMEHARQSCDLFALVTLRRAWNLLDDIADDVQNEDRLLEMYKNREAIENILADSFEHPEPSYYEFPPVTPEYRATLRSLLPEMK